MSQKNRTELRKKDFLVVRQTKNNNIAKVITPQTFQVGLDDSEFNKALIVKGNAQVEGRLIDTAGNPFIKGSGTVTVTEDSSGGVTITAALSADAALTGGTSGGFNSFSYDGSSATSISLDLDTVYGGLDIDSTYGLRIKPEELTNSLSTAQLNAGDYVIVGDTDDSGRAKKVLVGSLLASATGLATLGNTVTARDGMTSAVFDNTTNINFDVKPGTGIAIDGGTGTGGAVIVDPSNAVSAVIAGNDSVLFYDATASATRKTTIQSIADHASSYSVSAGTGITGTSYDGSSDSTFAIDTSVVPTLASANTFSGDNTFSNTINASDGIQIAPGTPLLVAGTNVSLSTATNGQVTISSTFAPGGSLTAGSAIKSFTYDGSSNTTVAVTADGLTATAPQRSSYVIVADSGNLDDLTRSTIGQIADTVDRTAIVNAGQAININYGNATTDPATFSVLFDNSTITLNGAGKLQADGVTTGPVGDPYATYLVLSTTSSLGNERVLTAGTGILSTDAGADSTFTMVIDDSVVATLTGSQFSGNVGITGSLGVEGSAIFATGLSGSLQTLADGSPYLREGNNITLVTAPNGSITISAQTSTGGSPGGGNSDKAATYLVLSATGSLDNERVLTAGTGINTVDSGAGSAYTIGVDNSVVATLTGSVFTGDVVFNSGLSGSLQLLSDGSTPYIIGTGSISVTTSSSGQLVISSSASGGGGGGLSTVGQAGGPTVTNVTSMVFTSSLVTDDGGGQVTVQPVIGAPAAGCDYSNGLFTSFSYETAIGEAICRINDILTQFSPLPPPDLDNINSDNTETVAYLSFGASSPTAGYMSVDSTAGYGTAMDVNSEYTIATASNNIRIGIVAGETVGGILNSDVASSSYYPSGIVNFPEFSFGKADQGEISLELNGIVIHTASMTDISIGAGDPGSGTGTDLNSNSSGFINLSVTGSGRFNDDTEFTGYQHRTANWQVDDSDQRDGWNYARVIHMISGVTSSATNYIEWVRDSDNNPISATNNQITAVDVGGIKRLSGVRYFKSGSAEYRVDVENAYRTVYDLNDITFTPTNLSIANISKPTIGVGEDSSKVLLLTGSATITDETLLNGSVSAAVSVTHPFSVKNLTNGGSTTASGFLLYNVADNSTATVETFRGESYRMMSGAFDLQSDVTGGSYDWDDSLHMSGTNTGHEDGLLFYNDLLVSPSNALGVLAGDFRDDADGGTLSFAPSGNPDYSGITSGQRTFYRKFQNTTGGPANSYSLQFEGSSNIVSDAGSLGTNSIKIYTKLPDDGSGNTTGWLDLSTLFSSGTYTDGSGARVYTADSTLDATLYGTFGTFDLANNDHLMLKVLADASWTGEIDQITAVFTNSDAVASDNVNAISSVDNGIDAKLSFGTAKPVQDFTNVGSGAGVGSAENTNDDYIDGTPNDNRLGIFAKDEDINGPVNTDTSTTGFADGHTGVLKLEVNGAEIPDAEIDLSSFAGSGYPGSGGSSVVNSDGTGFTNVSTAQPKTGSNNYPDFDKWFRTAQFNIDTADQRNGWNYARVIHTIGGADRITNYIEWVNDFYTTNMSYDNISIGEFGGSTIFSLSGVKYFDNSATTVSGSIFAEVSGSHSNIYYGGGDGCQIFDFTNSSTKQVSFNGTGFVAGSVSGDSTVSLPALDTAVSDAQSRSLQITASLNCTLTDSLPEDADSVGAKVRIRHPQKLTLDSAAQAKTTFLIFSASDTSSVNLSENFSGELYRLQAAGYANQSDVTSVSNVWDSTADMNSASGHDDGLLIYDGRLYSPKSKGNAGDFTNVREGGSYQGPDGNVDYSSLSNSERTYYRAFRNDTTSDVPEIRINMTGSAEIIPRGGAFASGSIGANNFIYVDVKIPGQTAWLDFARAGDTSNESDGDGCLKGTLDQTIDSGGAGSVCSFQGATANGTGGDTPPAASSDYVVIRITAHEDWTGNIDEINIGW